MRLSWLTALWLFDAVAADMCSCATEAHCQCAEGQCTWPMYCHCDCSDTSSWCGCKPFGKVTGVDRQSETASASHTENMTCEECRMKEQQMTQTCQISCRDPQQAMICAACVKAVDKIHKQCDALCSQSSLSNRSWTQKSNFRRHSLEEHAEAAERAEEA
uniref:Uncharacterized protein n=1 Tax=Chromera velia CCMP2878 TaxID=1169474 RepID=A0A0G4GFV5_9ALVE|eukprot:Cvel_4651.t1-p1 / transcript=Cvel_4651.t1 / gene=Cvel_4651 / organism=Chromera_velia_CCMP2878 / gene_product=hypothetical protein / transcript_product=hypothetical protein / location=Cvel_scaffold205:68548-69024(+) / protein_length=159 / sequence_SO=supercontig / SO=protein_coding / is_pseudo=false